MRVALGATRRHIVSLVLSEAMLLSMVSSILALGIAFAGLRLLRPLTNGLTRDEMTLDFRVLACALLLGILTTLLFGLLPAFRASQAEGTAGMRNRATSNRQHQRWQQGLLSAEVALSFVLLLGAGLLLRTFAAARAVNLGYQPSASSPISSPYRPIPLVSAW